MRSRLVAAFLGVLTLSAIHTGWALSAPIASQPSNEEIAATRQKAARGDPDAQLEVADWSCAGRYHTVRNFKEAAKWYRKAANQGNDTAANALGALYEFGVGVPRNHARALKLFEHRWNESWSLAATALSIGLAYLEGGTQTRVIECPLPVSKDVPKAAQWFQLSYEAGRRNRRPESAVAAHLLGELYASDPSMKDAAAARDWYAIAAGWGDAPAMIHLGKMYAEGAGVPEDHVLAVFWYRLAAQKEEPSALYELGRAYEHGLGVSPDPGTALDLYHRFLLQFDADQPEHSKALQAVINVLQEKLGPWENDGPAIARDREQAAEGDPWAQIALGLRYEEGLGVTPRWDKAMALFDVAAMAVPRKPEYVPHLGGRDHGYSQDDCNIYLRQVVEELSRPGHLLVTLDSAAANRPIVKDRFTHTILLGSNEDSSDFYPDIARRQGEEGRVLVEFHLNEVSLAVGAHVRQSDLGPKFHLQWNASVLADAALRLIGSQRFIVSSATKPKQKSAEVPDQNAVYRMTVIFCLEPGSSCDTAIPFPETEAMVVAAWKREDK
jgi:TPR repeat protein